MRVPDSTLYVEVVRGDEMLRAKRHADGGAAGLSEPAGLLRERVRGVDSCRIVWPEEIHFVVGLLVLVVELAMKK